MLRFQNLTGQRLGQYELRERLGSGGMGAVYRAYQANLKRDVAIKVLSTVLADRPEAVRRFDREAEIVAKLEHPNIVPIYDYGTDDDISFVVMRLLNGGSLAERILERSKSDQPLPSLKEVAQLLRQLASAIDYAHQRGVIHRDIKTNNIMFDDIGTALLVDFGIAKMVDATSPITDTGMAMGTPSHMSPEQWRGETVTAASDQYSLAVVIYALVTGRLPFDVDTPHAMMHKHLMEPPPHIKDFRPNLPENLNHTLEKALAKNPADRFLTVTDFMEAFGQAVENSSNTLTYFFTFPLPSKTPPPPHIPKTHLPFERTVTADNLPPKLTDEPIAADEAVVDNSLTTPLPRAAFPVTSPTPSSLSMAKTLEGITELAPITAVSSPTIPARHEINPTPRPNFARWTLFSILGLIALIVGWFLFQGPLLDNADSQDPTLLIPMTANISPSVAAQEESEYLTSTAQAITRQELKNSIALNQTAAASRWTSTPTLTSPTPSPTIPPVKFIDSPTVDSVEEKVRLNLSVVRAVAWHEDKLALSNETFVLIFDETALAMQDFRTSSLTWQAHPEEITSIVFNHDGSQLATGSEDNRVRLWDATTGKLLFNLGGHENDIYSVDFNLDSTILASCGVDGTIRLWDTTTGEEIAVLRGHTRSVEKLRFSPDGQYLASASSDRTLRLWDMETLETVRVFEGHTDLVLSVAFSPDGKQVVSGSADRSIRLWDITSGEELISIAHPYGFVLDVVFNADGSLIVSAGADGAIRFWDTLTYAEVKTLRGHTNTVNSIEFNGDGRWLASGSARDGTLRLWTIVDTE